MGSKGLNTQKSLQVVYSLHLDDIYSPHYNFEKFLTSYSFRTEIFREVPLPVSYVFVNSAAQICSDQPNH